MFVLQLKGYKTSNHFPNMFMFLEVRQCLDADSVYITKYKTYDVINWCVLHSSVYLLVMRTWAGKTDAVERHMIAIVWIVSEYVLYYTEETSFCRRHRVVVGIKFELSVATLITPEEFRDQKLRKPKDDYYRQILVAATKLF